MNRIRGLAAIDAWRPGQGGGMTYFANVGPKTGPVKYRSLPTSSIGVLESPTNHMPIGEAHCKTWNENGLAVWTLRIGGKPIAGRWVIIDREFRRGP
jgi:hypothetical protein